MPRPGLVEAELEGKLYALAVRCWNTVPSKRPPPLQLQDELVVLSKVTGVVANTAVSHTADYAKFVAAGAADSHTSDYAKFGAANTADPHTSDYAKFGAKFGAVGAADSHTADYAKFGFQKDEGDASRLEPHSFRERKASVCLGFEEGETDVDTEVDDNLVPTRL